MNTKTTLTLTHDEKSLMGNKFIPEKPFVFLVDIDNVILDTERAVLNRYNRRHHKDLGFKDVDDWDFFNGKVDDDFFSFLSEKEFWNNEVEPIEPVCNFVNYMALRPEWFKVKLVTATNPLNPALGTKLRFACDITGVSRNDVIVCRDKSLIHGDVMIDDSRENLNNSSCWHNWLIDRPWNRAVDHCSEAYNDSILSISDSFLRSQNFVKDLSRSNESSKQYALVLIN